MGYILAAVDQAPPLFYDAIRTPRAVLRSIPLWMNTSLVESVHRELVNFAQTGRSLVFVQTQDEAYLHQQLEHLALNLGVPLWIWKVNSGLEQAPGDTSDPAVALNHLMQSDIRPVVWFKDLHLHYRPDVLRSLRDIYSKWKHSSAMLVMSGPAATLPEEIRRECAWLRLDTPDHATVKSLVQAHFEQTGITNVDPLTVAATLKGLTLSEVRHALARLSPEQDQAQAMHEIAEEKQQLVQKMGTLEYIHKVPTMADLGGLEQLKEWLLARKQLLLSDDAANQAIAPKGILLMGVSGCGKSLCIKAISSAWQIPLYRMEMVNVFSGAFGPPEQAFAEACHTMETMAPAVLWIDEIEMGLSAEGSAQSDPSLARIFAFFLTWMQEKPPGLFVAATANRIDLLPAEMIRKGRFDQVFFVDLPSLAERRAIFEIHLQMRGFDPAQYELEVFADSTKGWNGAEIEQCVIAAITSARLENRDLDLKDLYLARKQIVPISTTMEEQVRHIRNWAYERAIKASKNEEH